MLRVSSKMKIYEYNGEKTNIPAPELEVTSHWNQESLVHLRIGEHDVVVCARDLICAVNNAQNSNRHG